MIPGQILNQSDNLDKSYQLAPPPCGDLVPPGALRLPGGLSMEGAGKDDIRLFQSPAHPDPYAQAIQHKTMAAGESLDKTGDIFHQEISIIVLLFALQQPPCQRSDGYPNSIPYLFEFVNASVFYEAISQLSFLRGPDLRGLGDP
jgi:hypothetical protein